VANYKIEQVEGIGPIVGEKLRAVGVSTTDELLAKSKTPAERQALSAASGLSEAQVLKFANMADLYRIGGVGSEFAELLVAAGVDTVPELAQRNAENLSKRMAKLNQEMDLTRHVPLESQVTRWVEQAKVLPRMVEI
jgi:predicted flap endonuclease-1-like 5' DNA nuclease